MTFLRISAAQAIALRKNYGAFHALDPIPLEGSTDYILTDAVLSEPAFAPALATLKALPTYPKWQSATAYAADDVVEYEGKLHVSVEAHTSKADEKPDALPDKWVSAHKDAKADAIAEQPVDERSVDAAATNR